MKIIVPMAGRGSRLRPHTLTVPKPLIPIAGKPIVQRLVEDIVSVCGDKKVTEIAFIIGDFFAIIIFHSVLRVEFYKFVHAGNVTIGCPYMAQKVCQMNVTV